MNVSVTEQQYDDGTMVRDVRLRSAFLRGEVGQPRYYHCRFEQTEGDAGDEADSLDEIAHWVKRIASQMRYQHEEEVRG